MQRRQFVSHSFAASAALATLHLGAKAQAETPAAPQKSGGSTEKSASSGPFKQPPLPYGLGELAPFLHQEQMDYHYNKHHAGYFKKLNSLTADKPEAKKSLEELIQTSVGFIFNNAAQAWNHTFFWNSMTPHGGGEPTGELAAAMVRSFGSFAEFKKEFAENAAALFGSGWTWLVLNPLNKLQVMPLPNADTPLRHQHTPILTLDVWEHAYYLDYRNDRARYIDGFWSKVNWDFAAKNLAAAPKKS
jgi:Fe-Mn family superoxide dismutase